MPFSSKAFLSRFTDGQKFPLESCHFPQHFPLSFGMPQLPQGSSARIRAEKPFLGNHPSIPGILGNSSIHQAWGLLSVWGPRAESKRCILSQVEFSRICCLHHGSFCNPHHPGKSQGQCLNLYFSFLSAESSFHAALGRGFGCYFECSPLSPSGSALGLSCLMGSQTPANDLIST